MKTKRKQNTNVGMISLLLFLMIISCKNETTNNNSYKKNQTTKQQTKQLDIQFSVYIDINKENEIHDAILAYDKKYGYPHDIIVIDRGVLHDSFTIDKDRTVNTIMYSQPGVIFVYPEQIHNEDTKRTKSSIFHEMSHTIKPFNNTILNKEYNLNEKGLKSIVYGFHGFKILVNVDGKHGIFGKIEESVCEYLAYKLYRDYTVQDLRYYTIGLFTTDMMELRNANEIQIAELLKKSDLIGFINILLNKENATMDDLAKVMTIYNDLYNKAYNHEEDIDSFVKLKIKEIQKIK